MEGEGEMKISEKKRQDLYEAIHNPIMELRVEIKMAVASHNKISAEGLDELLSGITDTVWSRQASILNIG